MDGKRWLKSHVFQQNQMSSEELGPSRELTIAAIDRSLSDLDLYMKFREGTTVIDLAISHHKDPKLMEAAVRRGRQIFDMEQNMRLRDAKLEGAIQNEKIRNAVRAKVAADMVSGIKTLLEGKRVAVETNHATGEVTLKEFLDPTVINMGIEQARKAISLEEKPMPQTVVNVQQNTNTINEAGGDAQFSFEQRLSKLRERQQQRAPVPNVIDVEAKNVEDDKPPKSEEELGF